MYLKPLEFSRSMFKDTKYGGVFTRIMFYLQARLGSITTLSTNKLQLSNIRIGVIRVSRIMSLCSFFGTVHS